VCAIRLGVEDLLSPLFIPYLLHDRFLHFDVAGHPYLVLDSLLSLPSLLNFVDRNRIFIANVLFMYIYRPVV